MQRFFLSLAMLMAATTFTSRAQQTVNRYASLVDSAFLHHHLAIIASDSMEGRETGTAGERRAAAYIENQFREWGLQPLPGAEGYRQYFPLHRDSTIETALTVNGKSLQWKKDFLIPASGNDNGAFEAAEWVFAGYGIQSDNYDDYKNLDVKGKVVVFFLGEPKQQKVYLVSQTDRSSEWTYPGLTRKLELAHRLGAAGALVISPTVKSFPNEYANSTRRTSLSFLREQSNPKVNYALLSHDFAKILLENNDWFNMAREAKPFTTATRKRKSATINLKYSEDREIVQSSNVAGMIEGSDKKDEYLFITAHYDHLGIRNGKIYNGADDDGSGTVAIMNMGKAFAEARKNGNGPRRTIVVMAFSGEEKGLWGSEYHSDNPLVPLEKTTAALNIDMIGRTDSERKGDDANYVYVVGNNKISTDLPKINVAANENSSKLTLDYKFDEPDDPHRIYFRSDHYHFARKGVPVLFFYDGMLKDDYHKPSDTIEKINWSLYEKRAKLIFHTAWEMANRNDMLIRDLPLPTATR